jgi:hypothetical protein
LIYTYNSMFLFVLFLLTIDRFIKTRILGGRVMKYVVRYFSELYYLIGEMALWLFQPVFSVRS